MGVKLVDKYIRHNKARVAKVSHSLPSLNINVYTIISLCFWDPKYQDAVA
jgi:hypothetical protein